LTAAGTRRHREPDRLRHSATRPMRFCMAFMHRYTERMAVTVRYPCEMQGYGTSSNTLGLDQL
jgi:hypothetical protein